MLGLRVAFRRLASTPGFTLVATLTIAIAIGGATAIFALVDAVLLKPLPYADSDRLLRVFWSLPASHLDIAYLRPEAVEEWRKLPLFAVFEPYQRRAATLLGAGDPEIVPTTAVGGGLMQTLGVAPLLGRTVQPADTRGSANRIAVIGERLWRTRFGSRTDVLGSTLRLDDETFVIVGVMPSRFRFPSPTTQVWTPAADMPRPGTPPRSSQAIARLRPGVTLEAAAAQMEAASRATGAPEATSYGWHVRLQPLNDSRADSTVRLALFVLLASVGILLLIACGNLAGLMLVRGAARSREFGIRAALGASRAHLIRSILAEAICLTLVATALGSLLSIVLTRLLVRFAPSDVVRLSYTEVGSDGRALLSAIVAAAVTTVLIGILPSFWITRTGLVDAVRTGSTSGGTRHQQRLRTGLVTLQLALSVVLLMSAGLLGRTLLRLSQVRPGFDIDHVLAVDLTVQEWKYGTPDAQRQMFARVLDRLRNLPGVTHVELSGGIPPAGGGTYEWRIETDDGRALTDDAVPILFNDVGPDYFGTLGISLPEGRAFTRADVASHAPAMILSRRLARRLWPAGAVSGHRIRFEQDGPWYTIVGVADDVLQLDQEEISASLAAYFPLSSRVPMIRTIALRTMVDPGALRESVRHAIHEIDREQPIAQIVTAREELASALAKPRFYAYLTGVFAGLAALLAAVGVYGVVAYVTGQRLREFALRLALGAAPAQVRRSVLRHGLVMAVPGVILGALASFASTRLMDALLVGGSHLDRLTYATTLAGAVALSLAASWIPARRAAAVDPAVTLRAE